jgi:hypothetical protein
MQLPSSAGKTAVTERSVIERNPSEKTFGFESRACGLTALQEAAIRTTPANHPALTEVINK